MSLQSSKIGIPCGGGKEQGYMLVSVHTAHGLDHGAVREGKYVPSVHLRLIDWGPCNKEISKRKKRPTI
jgi:hypothetical protein